MKALVLATLALASSFPALAGKDDQDVGNCGAYHLMLGNYDAVSEVARMASDTATMQLFARRLVKIAKTDPKGAASIGRYSCRQIGFRT